MELTQEQFLAQVERHLLKARGVDLSGYSPSFVLRAIRKRIGRSGAIDQSDYLRMLLRGEGETNELLNALSINVTEFFRDKGAFESFSAKVIRALLQEKISAGGGILRIWSAGCATGQETYTLAICLDQEMRKLPESRRFIASITGTDISAAALAKAKSGVYERDELKGVPDKYLSEYFVEVPEGAQVVEELRRRVRFSRENLLDRPGARYYDAIVCRNVLIYFSRPTHDVVLRNLHEALRLQGYLMLGRTEALMGAVRSDFEVVDQENRILRKKR